MSKTSQANDGRESMAWVVSDIKDATATVKAGNFGIVTGKASTDSAFASYEINTPFYAAKDITLAESDTCKLLTLSFMGFATAKDLSKSKETVDVTMDYDKETNKVTNGQVTVSGSINGMLLTEALGADTTAVNLIKSRFGSVVEVGTDGTVKTVQADTTNKDIILIFWNVRNAKAGDLVSITVAPVLFTSLAISAQYNSSQTMNLSFDGSATDENNYRGAELQVTFDDTLKSALPTARP